VVAQDGTSISWSSCTVSGVSTPGFPGWNADAGGWGGLGTLLGPEGAGMFCRIFSAGILGNWGVVVRLGLARHHNAFFVGVVGVCVGWFCP